MSKFNVKSSRKKIKTEIYESTQYHWNKKCYTFTDTDCDLGCSLHCNIFALLQFQTWGWWPPPSADRKANGTWPFQGSGATAPEYYKLSNFTYGSSSSYNIDDVPRYCFCVHAGNLNFLILQLLHHGVPGVDGCHPQMYRQATAVACGRPPRHRPPARCPSFILDLYFMFTIVPKEDDTAATILLQDYSTHTTRWSCCELPGDDTGRTDSTSFWHRPRTQMEEGRPHPTPTRTWSSWPAVIEHGPAGRGSVP